jgi:hypothetical protein
MSARREALLRQYEKDKHKAVAIAKVAVAKPESAAEVDVETARSETRRIIRRFLRRVAMPESEIDMWLRVYFDDLDPNWPLVWAVCVATGVGKTECTIEELVEWLRTVVIKGPVIYAVPLHKLSAEIEKKFAKHGINARRFLGRNQVDPKRKNKDLPKEDQIRMCLNPTRVELATKAHAPISETCCYKNRKNHCQFFNPGPGQCSYQEQQLDAEGVQVWIVASDVLFRTHKIFGKPAALIIDEGIWRKGIRGVAGGDEETKGTVAIDQLLKDGPFNMLKEIDERDSMRDLLGRRLLQQEEDGGIERQHLSFLSIKDCDRAVHLEWHFLPKLEMHPGMTDKEIRKLAKNEDLIADIRLTRRMVGIWKEIRWMLRCPEIAVSGRLFIKTIKGERFIKLRGVASISQQFWVPTLLLDATLPQPSILQAYHPQVETVAHIKVAMPPFVHIRQVLRAPTGSRKLNNEKHLEEIYRYILQRYLECGRGDTLVISQLKVEEWLKTKALPENIYLEHYNDIIGRDQYRNVRLEILVGRTAPGPREIEAMAGALSGSKPIEVKPNAKGFIWHPPVERVIRMQDGSGRMTSCDLHPDPAFGEPVRWLVHEGEQTQGEGRSRGVNRTADNPLNIDRLFNSYLPTPVNEVMPWQVPSLLITTAANGYMLTAPVDMTKVRPDLWPNEKAAYRTVQQGVPQLPGFVSVTYQLKGPNMKQRLAFFDLNIIPDPRAWLESKLGPLADFSLCPAAAYPEICSMVGSPDEHSDKIYKSLLS